MVSPFNGCTTARCLLTFEMIRIHTSSGKQMSNPECSWSGIRVWMMTFRIRNPRHAEVWLGHVEKNKQKTKHRVSLTPDPDRRAVKRARAYNHELICIVNALIPARRLVGPEEPQSIQGVSSASRRLIAALKGPLYWQQRRRGWRASVVMEAVMEFQWGPSPRGWWEEITLRVKELWLLAAAPRAPATDGTVTSADATGPRVWALPAATSAAAWN